MVNPFSVNTNASLSGSSVGDGRIFANLSQQTEATENAVAGTSFFSTMGFNFANSPWEASAPGSDTHYSASQGAGVVNNSHSPLPFGQSMTQNIGGSINASGKFFSFNGAWGGVGAFGLGNFDNASTSQQFSDT